LYLHVILPFPIGQDPATGQSGELSFAVGLKNLILDTTSIAGGMKTNGTLNTKLSIELSLIFVKETLLLLSIGVSLKRPSCKTLG
jgi:hypothetical protein